jgi:predicted enzyme related to lactoylglutathione lyase
MERARAMYSALLEREPNYASDEWTDYRIGDARFALHLRDGISIVSEVATVRNGAIVSFETPDIHGAVDRALSLGFSVTREPKVKPFGWLADLQDPWGNIFEFHQSRPH